MLTARVFSEVFIWVPDRHFIILFLFYSIFDLETTTKKQKYEKDDRNLGRIEERMGVFSYISKRNFLMYKKLPMDTI